MEIESAPLLPLAIFLVALLYSSVGHGGASGYLAVMALAGTSAVLLRPSALLLNLLVSALAFLHFRAAGHFRWKLFWPFAITSIPAAFAGAGITMEPSLYEQGLGVCLLFAVFRLLGILGGWEGGTRSIVLPVAAMIGLVIGLVSGMIGIGGGIILSPVLLLLRWANTYTAAAVSALFIFVNSFAGLAGLDDHTVLFDRQLLALLAAAFAGGLIGPYLGARKVKPAPSRWLLGMVLLAASLKLLVP